MTRTAKIWAATLAIGMSIPAASQALVLNIDTFDTPQSVSDVPGVGETVGSEVYAPEALGLYRDLYVETDASAPSSTILEVAASTLSFSNTFGTTGRGWITYDGLDGDPNGETGVDTTGLGGLNFLIGPDPYMFFDVVSRDETLEITVNAWDMSGNMVSYFEALTTELDPALPLSVFSGDPGFDWSQVGALQFYVNAPNANLDGGLASITLRSDVPVPAAALLLLTGLGGLAAVRARRS